MVLHKTTAGAFGALVHSVKVNNIVGSIIAVLFGYIMPFFMFMSGYNYSLEGLPKLTF